MRFEDWPERLGRIVEDAHRPFVWGEHDCCLFAANVVLELTGRDYAAELRGTYSSAKSAARVLKWLNGVRGIAGNALGAEIPPLTAHRGDIVLIHTAEHGDTLAVCVGAHCVAPGVDCLVHVPMSLAVAAWRVA